MQNFGSISSDLKLESVRFFEVEVKVWIPIDQLANCTPFRVRDKKKFYI